MLSLEEWHKRFLQQARWTESVRRFLFPQVELGRAERVLEVGCGSGAILADLTTQTDAYISGIDLKIDYLRQAINHVPDSRITCADAFNLPFASRAYSLTLCHYFLLWLAEPLQAIMEMKRVTTAGGYVLALAEPDYGGRIDFPEGLVNLGHLQSQALNRQGADPNVGRKIKGLFQKAGLHNVQAGVLGGQWGASVDLAEHLSEWEVMKTDLEGLLAEGELTRLTQIDLAAWQNGERILFVPTFYAWGRV
jgi:ubiquinone/menaquinone biosynthesis C-methylase UbiE